MDTKKKPAPGANREAGYDSSLDKRNHTPIRSQLKAAIVALALWGLLPAGLATWLIQRGGMRDA